MWKRVCRGLSGAPTYRLPLSLVSLTKFKLWNELTHVPDELLRRKKSGLPSLHFHLQFPLSISPLHCLARFLYSVFACLCSSKESKTLLLTKCFTGLDFTGFTRLKVLHNIYCELEGNTSDLYMSACVCVFVCVCLLSVCDLSSCCPLIMVHLRF